MLSQSFGETKDQDMVPDTFIDTFSSHSLDPSWYQLRTPYTKNYRFKKSTHHKSGGHSGLILNPNVFGLSDRDTPAALLRKQTSLNMTFSATLFSTAEPLNTRQSVGVSAYLSEFQHEDIGVTGCANSTGVCIFTTLIMNDTTTVSNFPVYRMTC